jgi:hypothetical protein
LLHLVPGEDSLVDCTLFFAFRRQERYWVVAGVMAVVEWEWEWEWVVGASIASTIASRSFAAVMIGGAKPSGSRSDSGSRSKHDVGALTFAREMIWIWIRRRRRRRRASGGFRDISRDISAQCLAGVGMENTGLSIRCRCR